MKPLYLIRDERSFVLARSTEDWRDDEGDLRFTPRGPVIRALCVYGVLEHLPELWCLPVGHYVEVHLDKKHQPGARLMLTMAVGYPHDATVSTISTNRFDYSRTPGVPVAGIDDKRLRALAKRAPWFIRINFPV